MVFQKNRKFKQCLRLDINQKAGPKSDLILFSSLFFFSLTKQCMKRAHMVIYMTSATDNQTQRKEMVEHAVWLPSNPTINCFQLGLTETHAKTEWTRQPCWNAHAHTRTHTHTHRERTQRQRKFCAVRKKEIIQTQMTKHFCRTHQRTPPRLRLGARPCSNAKLAS